MQDAKTHALHRALPSLQGFASYFFFFPVTVFGFQCLLEREGCGELEPAGQNILSEAQQFFSAFFFFKVAFFAAKSFFREKIIRNVLREIHFYVRCAQV